MSTSSEIKIYPYRWVVLLAFMLINVMVQILWIYYAPVLSQAAGIYRVSNDGINMLSNIFMLIYIPVAIPASWAIDHFGFKKAVGFGAILMGVFAMLRALFPANYTMALIGSIGISIGQPFLLSAFTKLAFIWFPKEHRATITGVMFLGLFLGIGLGEALTPSLVQSAGFSGMQMIYAVATVVSVVLFLVFARANPPTPASAPGDMVRSLVFDGLKKILKMKDVYILALALLLGSAIVNAVFMFIDPIGAEKGLSTAQGGTLTTILLVGGVVGSILMPAVSDGLRRRKAILIIGVLMTVPCVLLMVYGRGFVVEMISLFLLGFFVTGLNPLAYQYGAEITHPAPEGTSNGVFALVVQAAGFLILAMNALKNAFNGSYMPSFIGLAILMAVVGVLFFFNKESPEMGKEAPAKK